MANGQPMKSKSNKNLVKWSFRLLFTILFIASCSNIIFGRSLRVRLQNDQQISCERTHAHKYNWMIIFINCQQLKTTRTFNWRAENKPNGIWVDEKSRPNERYEKLLQSAFGKLLQLNGRCYQFRCQYSLSVNIFVRNNSRRFCVLFLDFGCR